MKYKCLNCSEYHDDWPAIVYNEPYHYKTLSDEDKDNIAKIDNDFCTIQYEDQTDYFIRVVLKLKVIDNCQGLDYGVWVSLSEKSFTDYLNNFKSDNHNASYFGFLCNNIVGYESTLGVNTDVIAKSGTERPEIFPHNVQIDNDFVKDYYNGISKEEAERRLKLLSEQKD